ncbi:aminotransferase class IV [Methylobacterium sp. A54F]
MLWRDGRIQAGTVAPFDLADRGLTLGDGVFDTCLALNGRVAYEAQHRDRLVAGAAALGFGLDPAAVTAAMRALAGEGGAGARLAIRTTATRGAGPRGLRPPAEPRPALFASAAPAAAALAFAPLRLWPTAIRRNETSPAARLKTLGYLDAVLAAREAAEAGLDEALFRNARGAVACAGTGNLFGVFGERLVTPPVADGVLAGIIRDRILALAPGCGLAPEETSLSPEALGGADAVFVTNSLRLLAPVTAIAEAAFPSERHPAVLRLASALRADLAAACGIAPEAVA